MSDELAWFKSSYSDTEGSDCVEVANALAVVHLRDSKTAPAGAPRLTFRPAAFAAFLGTVR
ncbi:DUF397 domain-containing protein [Streptomyces mayteni]